MRDLEKRTQYFVIKPNSGEVLYKGNDKDEARKRLIHQKDIAITSVSRLEDGVSIVREYYENYDYRNFYPAHIKQTYYSESETELVLEALGHVLKQGQ